MPTLGNVGETQSRRQTKRQVSSPSGWDLRPSNQRNASFSPSNRTLTRSLKKRHQPFLAGKNDTGKTLVRRIPTKPPGNFLSLAFFGMERRICPWMSIAS